MPKTANTSEAIRMLEDKRPWLISMGKRVAIALCKRDGGLTNSHILRQEMNSRGMFDGYDGTYFWMSAVFCDKGFFVWDGTYFAYSDRPNNIHERTVKVWKLARPDIKLEDVPLPCRPPKPVEGCPQMSFFKGADDFLKKPKGEPIK